MFACQIQSVIEELNSNEDLKEISPISLMYVILR